MHPPQAQLYQSNIIFFGYSRFSCLPHMRKLNFKMQSVTLYLINFMIKHWSALQTKGLWVARLIENARALPAVKIRILKYNNNCIAVVTHYRPFPIFYHWHDWNFNDIFTATDDHYENVMT